MPEETLSETPVRVPTPPTNKAKAKAKAKANSKDNGKASDEPTVTAKAKKKKDTPKAKAAKSAKSGESRRVGRSNFPPDAKITVVSKENPYRGSRAEKFKAIRTGMTVADYLKNGWGTRPLARAVESELIKIK